MVAGIESEFSRAAARSTHFARLTVKVGRLAAREQASANDPAVLAEAIWDAATAAKPRAHYSVRPDRRRVIMAWLPHRVTDRLLKKTFR